MLTYKTAKNGKQYSCEYCDFHTSDKTDYTRHCSTGKHKNLTNLTKNTDNNNDTYICSKCNKQYKSRMGLWSHSKKCEIILNVDDDISSNEPIKNYVMKLVEQNNDLRNMFLQQNNELLEIREQNNQIQTLISENPPQQIVNNNIQNNKITNNQFNLNVFLQQTCKDAINMSDFINSLKIDAASLHHTGTHGYVNGISKIFTDGLRKLKVHERPIHCSDLKREVLYIKDNDKWEKDTEDNKQFKKALDKVVYRNMGQLEKWVSKRSLQPGTAYGGSEEEENPRCRIQETDDYEFYFEVIRQSLGGGNHEVTARNNEKILKAIAKEVHIDRKVKELL